jgi:hypothetical protein
MKTRILFLFTLLCAAIASLQSVHAVTITVMNTNDSGAGSLRAALTSANDGDTIDFQAAVTGAVTLTTGQLIVDKSVAISGPGANNLTVDANHASRVFYVSPSTTVTISGLTITNGSFNGNGGGIYNDHATLTVTNSTLSGNSAPASDGGGIYNDNGTITITNSTLSGNSGPASGGGIYNLGTLTVSNSTLSGNSSIDPAPVPTTITDADAVLSLYGGKLPYRVRPNTTNGQQMVNDAATLSNYNSGLLTPGCPP